MNCKKQNKTKKQREEKKIRNKCHKFKIINLCKISVCQILFDFLIWCMFIADAKIHCDVIKRPLTTKNRSQYKLGHRL